MRGGHQAIVAGPWAVHEQLDKEDYAALAPDVLLPEQRRSARGLSPHLQWAEALYMAAVDGATTACDLEDAGEDVWFLFYDPFAMRVCGFLWCCSVLDLDPDWVRRLVRHRLEALDGVYQIEQPRTVRSLPCEMQSLLRREQGSRWSILTPARATLFADWARIHRESPHSRMTSLPRGTFRFAQATRLGRYPLRRVSSGLYSVPGYGD